MPSEFVNNPSFHHSYTSATQRATTNRLPLSLLQLPPTTASAPEQGSTFRLVQSALPLRYVPEHFILLTLGTERATENE